MSCWRWSAPAVSKRLVAFGLWPGSRRTLLRKLLKRYSGEAAQQHPERVVVFLTLKKMDHNIHLVPPSYSHHRTSCQRSNAHCHNIDVWHATATRKSRGLFSPRYCYDFMFFKAYEWSPKRRSTVGVLSGGADVDGDDNQLPSSVSYPQLLHYTIKKL